MAGKSVHGQPATAPNDHGGSSDIEEIESLAATSAIISSLFTQLDTLEKAQHESAEALRLQQQHSETLRRSIRDIERVLHQQHVARQRSRIKKLHKTATEAVEASPATEKQAEAKKNITTTATAKEATILAPKSTTPPTTISAPKAITIPANTSTISSTSRALQDAQQDTTMSMAMDEDDAEYYSLPPPPPPPPVPAPAPVAPMTTETPKASPKPLFSPVKQTPQSKDMAGAASKASVVSKSKPIRPVQKMVPSRGRPTRARGVTRGRIAISSCSSSNRSSPEAEEVPSPPKRGGIGIGTGRRSRPFKRGSVRASVSSADENEEPQFTPILSSSRRGGFTAVNTPRTWVDDLEAENRSPSNPPSGAGPSSKKPIPPPRSRRAADVDTPDEVALFSVKDLRAIYGGGNPWSICATVKPEDMAHAVVRTRNYICLSPDAHFKPPGTICDNAEMLDIYGQEDPVGNRLAAIPVFRKVNTSWVYCGHYKVGERRMVSVDEYHEGSKIVRNHWAKKVKDTEWGREWLVRKGWLVHGEIRNVTLTEVLGFFDITDDKKGLRFSSTALHFQDYDNVSYKKMVDHASNNYPHGIPVVPLSSLQPNRLILQPSSPAANRSHTSSPDPTPANKRRRQEGPAPTSVRTITTTTTTSAGRGARRISRGVENYRIAPMNEFTTEEGGKGMEEVVNLESESDGVAKPKHNRGGVEDDSEEEDDEGDEESGEDVMVLE